MPTACPPLAPTAEGQRPVETPLDFPWAVPDLGSPPRELLRGILSEIMGVQFRPPGDVQDLASGFSDALAHLHCLRDHGVPVTAEG